MSIKLSFNTQKENNSPQIVINKSVPQVNNVSNLHMFKSIEKTNIPNEQDDLQNNKTEKVLLELETMVGLSEVKKLILELQAYIEIQRKREKENLRADSMVLHMIFKGNPGTGKTTVARIIGQLLKEMGVLKKGHVIEVERADMVGEYIGHTALKTREQIKRALGGVLFIDEAYSLARGGERDFGKEAIDTMVKAMEDHKDNLILILAGYKDEMVYFMESNPGLRSRFPIHIDFPDYSTNELMEIAEQMINTRQYQFTEEAKKELEKVINNHLLTHKHNGNARLIRNIIEKTMRQQAIRLVSRSNVTREELILITWHDVRQIV
ncbi:MAG: AAA family ATPase [Clostridia bacterium]|nr:AAA family ATPase [Clostridia bacterium]MDD4047298.1 AAA family ATPase [Clostridia bacterium]